jgi:hypothetical protein
MIKLSIKGTAVLEQTICCKSLERNTPEMSIKNLYIPEREMRKTYNREKMGKSKRHRVKLGENLKV